MARTILAVRLSVIAAGAGLIALIPAAAAHAATSIDGPLDLGTAAPFAVLAHTTVTSANVSTVNGDLGLSPGTEVTGFPPGILNGTLHQTDSVAAQAKVDLTTAYDVAASLTPSQTGMTDLVGMSLTPGVYSGGALSLSGELTLAGTADSVWVFQASSTLIVDSGALITVTGGASACNVFWQVGSSATIGTGADFVGTVMADASITANTSAVVTGRLLARTGAVTLDTNTITAPVDCVAAGTVTTTPDSTPTDTTTPADTTPSPELAATGLDSTTGSLLALSLVIAGVVVLRGSRRRDSY